MLEQNNHIYSLLHFVVNMYIPLILLHIIVVVSLHIKKKTVSFYPKKKNCLCI